MTTGEQKMTITISPGTVDIAALKRLLKYNTARLRLELLKDFAARHRAKANQWRELAEAREWQERRARVNNELWLHGDAVEQPLADVPRATLSNRQVYELSVAKALLDAPKWLLISMPVVAILTAVLVLYWLSCGGRVAGCGP